MGFEIPDCKVVVRFCINNSYLFMIEPFQDIMFWYLTLF